MPKLEAERKIGEGISYLENARCRQAQWLMLTIPAIGILREKSCCKFKAILGYIVSYGPAWPRVRFYKQTNKSSEGRK